MNMKNKIHLPPSVNPGSRPASISSNRIAIIGANGAGKSRFMDELAHLCEGRAYSLNALSAFYPELQESTTKGSIDSQYREATRSRNYLRSDAVSELDKLEYLLFAEEMESLMRAKEQGNHRVPPTRLDTLRDIWARLFPGSRVSSVSGQLMFSTLAGADLIPSSRLSQGEKTALYYIAAVLYAMHEAVVLIDSPGLFVHPGLAATLWNLLEEARPDCTFVYNSVDSDFVSSRADCLCIWVRNYISEDHAWDYELLDRERVEESMMMEFAGGRRPVLFIEGDSTHSIDIRLYSLVFPDMSVRPLGSCSKVIETTRSFNDLASLHHLRSRGIVDRDRRTDQEVEYLRKKQILVADVAEIENIFLHPGIIRIMARHRGRDGSKILGRVKRDIIKNFRKHSEEQALQHVRHKIKRDVECRIDSRFTCITALELHLRGLEGKLQPRRHYNRLRESFAALVRDEDYEGILKVFNHKPMLSECGIAQMLGYKSRDEYVQGVIDMLKSRGKTSAELRKKIRECLHADEQPPSESQRRQEKDDASNKRKEKSVY